MSTMKAFAIVALPALFSSLAACGHPQGGDPMDVPGFVRTMERALASPDPTTRHAAARALGIVGPRAGDAIPFLMEAMCDDEARVRDAADLAIRRIEGTVMAYANPERQTQVRP
jgi:HEAT repeat protein